MILAFVASPILSKYSVSEYFANSQTYLYMLNGLLIPIHNLPDVCIDSIYDQTVNGPLWILPIGFTCYIFCYFIHSFNLLNKKRYPIVLASCLLYIVGIYCFYNENSMLASIFRPALLFVVGMGFYVYQD